MSKRQKTDGDGGDCFGCGKKAGARGKHKQECWAYLVTGGEDNLTQAGKDNAIALAECMKGATVDGEVFGDVDAKLMISLQEERSKLAAALKYVKAQKATLMRAASVKTEAVPYATRWSASAGLLTITWNGIATTLDEDGLVSQSRAGGEGGSSE